MASVVTQDGGNDAEEKSATEGNDTQPAAVETAESYKRLLMQPVTMPDLSHCGIQGVMGESDARETTGMMRKTIRSASKALDNLDRKEQRELQAKRKENRRRKTRLRNVSQASYRSGTSGTFATQPSVEELFEHDLHMMSEDDGVIVAQERQENFDEKDEGNNQDDNIDTLT